MTRWLLTFLVSVLGLSGLSVHADDVKVLPLPGLPPFGALLNPPADGKLVLPSPLWWLTTVPLEKTTLYTLSNITPTVTYTVQKIPKGTLVPKTKAVRSLEKFDLLLHAIPGSDMYQTRCDVHVGYRFDSRTDRLPRTSRRMSTAQRRFMASTWVFVSVETRDLAQNLVGRIQYAYEVEAVLKSLNLIKEMGPPPRIHRPPTPVLIAD